MSTLSAVKAVTNAARAKRQSQGADLIGASNYALGYLEATFGMILDRLPEAERNKAMATLALMVEASC